MQLLARGLRMRHQVRQLQILCPGIRIWLDVDNLKDVGGLEEAIGGCATVVMLLSHGYFASKNCRREVYVSATPT